MLPQAAHASAAVGQLGVQGNDPLVKRTMQATRGDELGEANCCCCSPFASWLSSGGAQSFGSSAGSRAAFQPQALTLLSSLCCCCCAPRSYGAFHRAVELATGRAVSARSGSSFCSSSLPCLGLQTGAGAFRSPLALSAETQPSASRPDPSAALFSCPGKALSGQGGFFAAQTQRGLVSWKEQPRQQRLGSLSCEGLSCRG